MNDYSSNRNSEKSDLTEELVRKKTLRPENN